MINNTGNQKCPYTFLLSHVKFLPELNMYISGGEKKKNFKYENSLCGYYIASLIFLIVLS